MFTIYMITNKLLLLYSRFFALSFFSKIANMTGVLLFKSQIKRRNTWLRWKVFLTFKSLVFIQLPLSLSQTVTIIMFWGLVKILDYSDWTSLSKIILCMNELWCLMKRKQCNGFWTLLWTRKNIRKKQRLVVSYNVKCGNWSSFEYNAFHILSSLITSSVKDEITWNLVNFHKWRNIPFCHIYSSPHALFYKKIIL